MWTLWRKWTYGFILPDATLLPVNSTSRKDTSGCTPELEPVCFVSSCRCELCAARDVSPEAAHRILPDPGVLPLHPRGRAVLGLILDQPRGHRRQDRTRSVPYKNRQFNRWFQIWLRGRLCKKFLVRACPHVPSPCPGPSKSRQSLTLCQVWTTIDWQIGFRDGNEDGNV